MEKDEGENNEDEDDMSLEVAEVNENSDSLVMDVDETQTEQVEVVAIGGSNCKKLQVNLSGSDDLTINANVLCEPGLKIEGASRQIGLLTQDEREKIQIVAVHVGTCNFPITDFSSLDFIFQVYVKQLLNIRKHCPNSHVIISSVIPRNGIRPAMQEINEQIRQFNARLRDFSQTDECLHFCNNYSYLMNENLCVNSEYYKSADRDGVHLNRVGRNALATALKWQD